MKQKHLTLDEREFIEDKKAVLFTAIESTSDRNLEPRVYAIQSQSRWFARTSS